MSLEREIRYFNSKSHLHKFKTDFNRILKIIGEQNQLPISFDIALVCNKILKAQDYFADHKNF